MRRDRPFTGRRSRLTLLVAGLLLVAGTSSCGTDGTTVVEASGAPDSRKLVLSIASCNPEAVTTDIEEAGDSVRILVQTEGPDEGPDCGHSMTVTLDEPLGSRDLIDLSTRDTVRVRPPDS
jgi:hypothetical protein